MKILCPSCKSISIVELPILLAVCACGTLVRAKIPSGALNNEGLKQQGAAEISHYEILGILRTASSEEIKAAYRRKVKETHPDAGGNADDFKLVQMAWEILNNLERRRLYDSEELTSNRRLQVDIPDLIGMTAVQAVRSAAEIGVVVRVAIIQVESRSKLHGRAIGQFPYPGHQSESNVVGIVIAISGAATIWQRIGAIASDLALGFWTGLISTTVGNSSPHHELGERTTSRNVGAFVGETVGEIATDAVQVTLGFLNCLGYVVLAVITLIALAINPGIGLLFLGLSGFAIYKDRQKRSQRW